MPICIPWIIYDRYFKWAQAFMKYMMAKFSVKCYEPTISTLPASHQDAHISHNSHAIQDQLTPDMPWIYIQRSTYGPLDRWRESIRQVHYVRHFFFTEKHRRLQKSTWIRIFIRMILNRKPPVWFLDFRFGCPRFQSKNAERLKNLDLQDSNSNHKTLCIGILSCWTFRTNSGFNAHSFYSVAYTIS